MGQSAFGRFLTLTSTGPWTSSYSSNVLEYSARLVRQKGNWLKCHSDITQPAEIISPRASLYGSMALVSPTVRMSREASLWLERTFLACCEWAHYCCYSISVVFLVFRHISTNQSQAGSGMNAALMRGT